MPGLQTEMVAWLGHTICGMPWELAGAPEVRNQAGVIWFYQRIGRAEASGATSESATVQEVWTTEFYEVLAAGHG